MKSEFTITMDSNSENESFARVAVSAFISRLNPTIEEINDIKTAVSEAITNSIIHGYTDSSGKISLTCKIIGQEVIIQIRDYGLGIDDIKKAMQPLYTSKPDMERSGIGFTVMETFMDKIFVESKRNCGTTITMTKNLIAS